MSTRNLDQRHERRVGKSLLHNDVIARLGFDELGRLTGKAQQSLTRMLSRTGNSQARNLFEVTASSRSTKASKRRCGTASQETQRSWQVFLLRSPSRVLFGISALELPPASKNQFVKRAIKITLPIHFLFRWYSSKSTLQGSVLMK